MERPTDHTNDDWQSCEQGEISQLVTRLQSRRRAHRIERGLIAATLVLGAAFVGYYVVGVRGRSVPDEPHYGGIVCGEVRELAPQYLAGEVDEATAARIARHLEKCPECRQMLQEMKSRRRGSEEAEQAANEQPGRRKTADAPARQNLPALAAAGSRRATAAR